MSAFLAGLAAFLADVPVLNTWFTKIAQLFTKTAAQEAQETAAQEQDEASTLAKTGRPNPND